jgi:hypothetical protein
LLAWIRRITSWTDLSITHELGIVTAAQGIRALSQSSFFK